MREFIPISSRFMALPPYFSMKMGGTVTKGKIAYETFGKLNKEKSNAILLLSGLSADAHACSTTADANLGWWEMIIGKGKAIDTSDWFIICVNHLGSCKGSTGPATINSENEKPWALEFPTLTIEDIANAAAYVVNGLGIKNWLVLSVPQWEE